MHEGVEYMGFAEGPQVNFVTKVLLTHRDRERILVSFDKIQQSEKLILNAEKKKTKKFKAVLFGVVIGEAVKDVLGIVIIYELIKNGIIKI